jgi:hypothetical protein
LIDIVKHAFEVFNTPNITILKDTPITKRPWLKLIPLDEHVDTTNEQSIDDLITRVKHVNLGD